MSNYVASSGFRKFSAKEFIWDRKKKEIKNTTDALGEKIDEKVKEAVIALNIWDFPTSASCEGHIDRGISAPWIEISAPNEPKERFIDEKKIYEKVANKYGISSEEVKRGMRRKAWIEAVKEASKNDETPKYKKWRNKNKQLMEKTYDFLKEFYQNRKVAKNISLQISEMAEGNFRIHNGGKDYRLVPKDLNEQEKNQLAKRLTQYQKEMKKFANFLKDKFFKR